MPRHNRRTILKGTLASVLGLSIASAASSEEDDREHTIEWKQQGSEHATQECSGKAYWKFVLTPGGPEEIEDPVLEVGFEDGSHEEIRLEKSSRGAVHFEVVKDGGGTIDEAWVRFNGGDEDNAVLTISEGGCKAKEEDGDDKPDEPDEPDKPDKPDEDEKEEEDDEDEEEEKDEKDDDEDEDEDEEEEDDDEDEEDEEDEDDDEVEEDEKDEKDDEEQEDEKDDEEGKDDEEEKEVKDDKPDKPDEDDDC